jgi:hypothetical protein
MNGCGAAFGPRLFTWKNGTVFRMYGQEKAAGPAK